VIQGGPFQHKVCFLLPQTKEHLDVQKSKFELN